MADGQIDSQAIEKVLRDFSDPETGRSVAQQEQVRDLLIEGDRLSLTLALTTHSAPLWKQAQASLEEKLRESCPALKEVAINLAIHQRPAEKLGEIGLTAKSVIAVGSGKGGVGKSTIAASIAFGLKRAGCRVGLMDADVYGPSLPHLLGIKGRPEVRDQKLQPVDAGGMPVMSMGFLVPEGEAVVWRGPMLHGAITQFLRDTNWGELDYLIIDMPPGTGDIALTLSQLVPLSGSVIVCTPQDVALLDAVKAIAMFRKVNIPILGLVENMSYFECSNCHQRHDIFGSGGAKQRAKQLEVPFLGEVPINIQIRIRGDEGQTEGNFEDAASAPYLEAICQNLARQLSDSRKHDPQLPSLAVLGG
jgi:ATP-binding protein involved in chromosome partitioning